MSGIKGNKAIILNMVVPIFTGGLIYYIMSPDVLFVKLVDEFMGGGLHIFSVYADNSILRFIRYYFLDMLWGYALVFTLFLMLGSDTADLKKVFAVALIFTIIMEGIQLFSIFRGTFDVWDIVAMFLSEVLAVFVIRRVTVQRELLKNMS